MLNVFRSFLTITLLICSTACASSSSSEEGENLITYRFKSRASFDANLRTVCERADVVGLDLTKIAITDEDLKTLFGALVTRERTLEGKDHHISLIDLRFGTITERGFLSFLESLQNGSDIGGGLKIRPDVRETILKTGLGLTDDFIEEMQKVAPSILAGGIEIVQ